MEQPRCSCCNFPFEVSSIVRLINGFPYCAVCAADIENAGRMD